MMIIIAIWLVGFGLWGSYLAVHAPDTDTPGLMGMVVVFNGALWPITLPIMIAKYLRIRKGEDDDVEHSNL